MADVIELSRGAGEPLTQFPYSFFTLNVRNSANKEGGTMRKESATIRRCHSQLSALGLDSDAVFHRSKLILKIYRDVVWVLSERVEELQEYAWDLGKQDIDTLKAGCSWR